MSKHDMPTIRFEPTLIEAVVTAAVAASERAADSWLAVAYHRQANPIYDHTRPAERESAFDTLYTRLFDSLGFMKLFTWLFGELPTLQQQAPALLVMTARAKHEEGAVMGRDGQSVCLRVSSERFAEGESLVSFVRHELLHAADMLNASFGYAKAPLRCPKDQLTAERPATLSAINALAERYRALWCAYVDARLVRRDVEPLADCEAHRRECENLFELMPSAVFERVWHVEPLTYDELMAMARAQQGQRRTVRLGALCPLCKFPTHHWAKTLEPHIADAIRADFPAWRAEDGACERCVECYVMRVQVVPV
jgi:hypothetical protein